MEIPLGFPSIVTTRRIVPNEFPIAEAHPYKIALIGEAPGEQEEDHLRPFVGPSGNLLNSILRDVGLDRHRCFLGNICQVRPPANAISAFAWDGDEIQSGLKQLNEDLKTFNPHLCVLLGGTPLRSARADAKAKITEWRGSLFVGDPVNGNVNPFASRKCLPTLHPAFVLREWSGFPLLCFDLKRAADEGGSPTLNLPQRELRTDIPAGELCYIMDNWPSGQRLSMDIEGGLGGWPCVSICARPTKSITIAWGKLNEEEHVRVLRSFARLLWRTDVPKILQNCLYDNFVLSYGFGCPIRRISDDVMLRGWEVYCELPKGLGTQTSIWTREPFYKAERKSTDSEVFFQYCAKDSAVTLEICNAQDQVLTGSALQHYRFNLAMLNPLLFMELRGIKYDTIQVEKLARPRRKAHRKIGDWLDAQAGEPLRGPKGSLVPQRLCRVLYERKGYPAQFKKEAGRKTEKLTSDVEAILTLARRLPSDRFLNAILRHRHLEGLLETLAIKADPDGRVRCGYNVVGTETGRLTCYTSPTGAGANLTTITKSLRRNYIADPGYDFFQCDLEGADGWTVAAHAARLGDDRMLLDYRAGLKPAKIIALLYWFGGVINELDRSDVKWLHDRIFPIVSTLVGKWLYMACKRVQHGSNYLMGIPTMIKQVLLDSYKYAGTPIYVEQNEARTLQNLYFSRYPGVRTWHQWAESKLVADGKLTSASGHTRIFFGRRFGRDIHDTVKEFLADEPQQNTTYATNCAMLRLWNDPENRRSNGSLTIEPLHQVHDALCGQWPQSRRDWARTKIREWFNNELEIAGIRITIPFDGTWGPSWGEMPNKL